LIVREGAVEIETILAFEKGPGRISPGFYNRTMEVSRDLTVALLKTQKPGIALDSMAGTGIRGLRIAKETEWKVVLNDRDSRNTEIQKNNARLNSVDLEIERSDYFCAVSSRKWDYIDVDPFGTASGLVEAAIMNLKNDGIVGVTMTDTANLEGKSLDKGKRIYGSRSMKGTYSREISTRIFLSYVMSRGASLGRAGRPLLVLRDGHFIRVFVRFKKGNKVADDSLKSLQMVSVEGENVGPLYTGKLYDPLVLKGMENFPFSESSKKLFSNFGNEDLMFLFYGNSNDVHEVKKSRIVDELKKRGYEAGSTNFNEKGIKSNTDSEEYRKILSAL
jgi:tRNA (guanine26-N2/guanine27-N2)-dimethyltransferase